VDSARDGPKRFEDRPMADAPPIITTDPANGGTLFQDGARYYVKVTVNKQSDVTAFLTPSGQNQIPSDNNPTAVPANTATNFYFSNAPPGASCDLEVDATSTGGGQSQRILTVNTPGRSRA
jgi:hypothetical protein